MNLLLFVPDKVFELFYLSFALIAVTKVRYIKKSILFLPLITFPFIYRYLLTYDTSELKELIKLVYMVILLSCIGKNNRFNLRYIKLFFIINLIITICQFFKIGNVEFITHFYVRDNHLIGLQWDSVRAPGIFSDPASNAIVALFGFMYFARTYQKTYLVMSMLVILLSQSKTVYLALLVYVFLSSSFWYKLIFGSLLITLYSKYSHYIFQVFSQLDTLISGGIMTSSFRARLLNWQNIYFTWLDGVDNFLIGPGRSGFSRLANKTSVIDSDYLYILLNYGLIGLILICISIIYYIKLSKRFSVIASILVLAVSLAPLFMPRTFMWFLIFNKKDVLGPS